MYGQTEAAPRLSYLQPTKTRAKPGSVGQAIPGVQIRIVQDDGAECPVGEEGNLIAFGPNVMQGYWKHPEETAKVLKNGWLHTGDIAYVDADGDLCITGRKKQFLKVGGRRIRPGEIERVCQEYPEISEAAVIGVPDDVLGQRIKLFVATTADVNKEELTLFFRKRLPSYMIPVETVIMEQLPKKSNGKVDKKKLA
jgi:acyl-CoA synthetase (AMP-forming)/AMP-acid ligase II